MAASAFPSLPHQFLQRHPGLHLGQGCSCCFRNHSDSISERQLPLTWQVSVGIPLLASWFYGVYTIVSVSLLVGKVTFNPPFAVSGHNGRFLHAIFAGAIPMILVPLK